MEDHWPPPWAAADAILKSLTGFSGYSQKNPVADNAVDMPLKKPWKHLLELRVEALKRAWTSDLCLQLGYEFRKDHFPKYLPGEYCGLSYHIFRSAKEHIGISSVSSSCLPKKIPMYHACPSSSPFSRGRSCRCEWKFRHENIQQNLIALQEENLPACP